MQQPSIETQRLVLRPFVETDAANVERLANDKRIAEVTINIPHPYPKGLAKTWILSHESLWKKREQVIFAITLKETTEFIGCISLMKIADNQGELGYWLGVDYWNHGYCSEACKSVVEFGFESLKLNRIYARHLRRNPASGKVLLKSGLAHIGSSKAQISGEVIELYEKIKNSGFVC